MDACCVKVISFVKQLTVCLQPHGVSFSFTHEHYSSCDVLGDTHCFCSVIWGSDSAASIQTAAELLLFRSPERFVSVYRLNEMSDLLHHYEIT